MSNTDSELDSLLQHVQETWRLKRSLEDVQRQKQQLQAELNDLTTKEISIKKDLRDAKKLMDHCLQTGEDATVAKLTKNTLDMTRWDLEYEQMSNYAVRKMDDLIYNRLTKGGLGALGATGP